MLDIISISQRLQSEKLGSEEPPHSCELVKCWAVAASI